MQQKLTQVFLALIVHMMSILDHKFQLQLTANCTANFQNFQFNFFPPFDWEDTGSIVFEYTFTNKTYHKEFTWDSNGKVHEF